MLDYPHIVDVDAAAEETKVVPTSEMASNQVKLPVKSNSNQNLMIDSMQ